MEDIYEIRDKSGMNRSEWKLYVAMTGIGLKPIPQYKISEMTVDFAFPDEKLVIEVNGVYHQTPEQRERDIKRWYVLNKLGWTRKTFNANKVDECNVFIAEKIKEEIVKINGIPENKTEEILENSQKRLIEEPKKQTEEKFDYYKFVDDNQTKKNYKSSFIKNNGSFLAFGGYTLAIFGIISIPLTMGNFIMPSFAISLLGCFLVYLTS